MVDLGSRIAEVRVTGLADQMQSPSPQEAVESGTLMLSPLSYIKANAPRFGLRFFHQLSDGIEYHPKLGIILFFKFSQPTG